MTPLSLVRLLSGGVWLCAFALVFAFAPDARAQDAATPPPPPVTFIEVASATIPVERDYPARLVATQSVLLQAQVGGVIAKRVFKEGAVVEKGALLYLIDSESYEIALALDQAQVKAAETALKFAELEVERFTPLAKENITSQRQLQQLTEQRDNALAQLELAQAARAAAELALRRTRITAPIAGRMGLAQADVGDLVLANQTPLTRLVQWDPVEAHFYPPAQDFPLIESYHSDAPLQVSLFLPQNGDNAAETNGAMAGHEFAAMGALDFIDSEVSDTTNTILMRASIPNADARLRPGQFARARVHITEQPNTLLVPRKAVKQRQGAFIVHIVDDDNLLQERIVKPGGVFQSQRIILDGVEQGERVVVSDVTQVPAGIPVMPRPAAASEESAPTQP